MPSEKEVMETINKAEAAFSKCWESLAVFKKGPRSAVTADLLYEFQPTLYEPLMDLQRLYREVEQTKKN